MWKDPIVEEIHAIREQIAKECDYDLDKIFERLRKKQREHPERVVEARKADTKGMIPPNQPETEPPHER